MQVYHGGIMLDINLSLRIELSHAQGSNLNLLRQNDLIPGVISYSSKDSTPVMMTKTSLEKIKNKRNEVLRIKGLEGQKKGQLAMLVGVQRDPIKQSPLHFSLQGLSEKDLNLVTERTVKIVTTGKPKWLKPFHTIQTPIDKMTVIGKPKDIPNVITINMENMDEGEVLHASDISMPRGVNVSEEDRDKAVITVTSQVFKEEENGSDASGTLGVLDEKIEKSAEV